MAKKNWRGLHRTAEECNELGVELMKLAAYPDGKHPSRKRSVILSTEDEIADVEAITEYFKKRNRLDETRIAKRKASKLKKYSKLWGNPDRRKKKSVKKTPKAKNQQAQRTVTRRNVTKRT